MKNLNLKIRNIEEKDYLKVYETVREAFWNLYCPGCSEHLLAKRIFEHKDYIPELSFLLETDGEIVGCILYTKSKIVSGSKQVDVVTFGPVCIVPRFQRQGLGRILITHSIEAAKKKNIKAIIITGDRKNYFCYGFKGAKEYGISMADNKFYYCLMALPLQENLRMNLAGNIIFSDCMNDLSQSDIAEFDESFEPKVKKVLPCQEEFLKEVDRLDED